MYGGAALGFHREDGDPSGANTGDQPGVTVSDDELAWARKVVALFAANPDAGTIALDGKMIDRPHLTLARRLLGLGGG